MTAIAPGDPPPDRPGRIQRPDQPGGCGLSGCLVLATVVCAILLGIMIVMAVMRPTMGPGLLAPP